MANHGFPSLAKQNSWLEEYFYAKHILSSNHPMV
jgi:hypothetical protein